MTSVQTVGAARVASDSKIPSKASVLDASLTAIKPADKAEAKLTLAAWHGGHGGHGPVIVVHPHPVPRPHYPHYPHYPRPHGPIIVVPLPIPQIGFHMCYPGEEYTARDVRRDAYGRYWCSDF